MKRRIPATLKAFVILKPYSSSLNELHITLLVGYFLRMKREKSWSRNALFIVYKASFHVTIGRLRCEREFTRLCVEHSPDVREYLTFAVR